MAFISLTSAPCTKSKYVAVCTFKVSYNKHKKNMMRKKTINKLRYAIQNIYKNVKLSVILSAITIDYHIVMP